MRTTEIPRKERSTLLRGTRAATAVALLGLGLVALLGLAGCSTPDAEKSDGSNEASAPVGKRMAGPAQKIVISKAAIANKPKPWVLSDPESAVRSYLDWTSYAYRIAESAAATPTMSEEQEVRVDSYTQLNLQKSKVLEQKLDSITFGKPSVGSTSTLLPAKEKWTYRYVSIKDADETVAGPFRIDYATTYVVVKNKLGNWVVDDVRVKALGEVK